MFRLHSIELDEDVNTYKLGRWADIFGLEPSAFHPHDVRDFSVRFSLVRIQIFQEMLEPIIVFTHDANKQIIE